jgi:hypothetical protein
MTRKLLPYEHDLIATLGITKEEYLDFLAIQQTYTDAKEGTIFDIRNDPVSIVLAVIGIIFQVVSVLLTPRPEIPSITAGGERQTREQRFSPRFGFNSVQELGKYGDTVPLVYTDRSDSGNPNGGVRVAGTLLWSAVRSYGSNQFLQMLMLLTGGQITRVDINKSAFGQTVITDLIAQNKWIYMGLTGPLHWFNEASFSSDSDPTKYGSANENPYRLQPGIENTRVDGFSQAYSPSSSNIFGGYSPVPINVKTYLRNEAGDKGSTDIQITASSQAWNTGALAVIPLNQTLQIRFASTANSPDGATFEDDLVRTAMDTRRTLASVFDDAGIFKLGSARYRTNRITGTTTDEGDFVVDLVCIEAGRAPSLNYTYDEVIDTAQDVINSPDYQRCKRTVDNLLALDQRNTMATAYDSDGNYQYDYLQYGGSIPENERFVVLDAQALLNSGNIYGIESYTANYYDYDYGEERYYTDYRLVFFRAITPAERTDIQRFIELENARQVGSDDLFYLKAITRVEEASYTTVSQCNIVDIALKAQVYRRISGRQQSYGSQRRAGYAASDNGIQQRTSMFLLHYRIAGGAYTTAPGIFVVRRAAEQDNFIYIKFNGGFTPQNWQFRLEPILDPLAEIAKHSFLRQANGLVRYFYLQNSGNAATFNLGSGRTLYFTGFTQDSQTSGLPPLNESANGTNEWDLFSLDADTQLQTSFERGPELAITAVSEQLIQNFTPALYSNLSLVGFNVFSGKSLQDMRSFSTFITGGKPVRRLRTYFPDENGNPWGSANYNYYPAQPDGPTSFAPDIFLDTILDTQDGIGNYAKINGIDIRQLAITKRFCDANNLYMDALIADRQNWRSFWAANAPFSLLEFARMGGRETLIPSVPYNELTGAIQRQIQVSALFNQGNILEDSYKEEFLDYDSNVQDIIATVIYRSLDSNGTFSVNRSITIQRSDTNPANAILQSFDASAFVTNEAQAILFGKLMCNTRRYVRSAIEFKTFPTTSPISPGSYIYVDIGHNSWDGITAGVVGPGGKLNSPVDNTVRNGSYSFLLYQSGNGVVQTTATVTDNIAAALATREGYLYVLGTKVKSRRVFRVNEVQMDEEGEVTVRGTIFPCDASDNSLIADFSDNLFTIQR